MYVTKPLAQPILRLRLRRWYFQLYLKILGARITGVKLWKNMKKLLHISLLLRRRFLRVIRGHRVQERPCLRAQLAFIEGTSRSRIRRSRLRLPRGARIIFYLLLRLLGKEKEKIRKFYSELELFVRLFFKCMMIEVTKVLIQRDAIDSRNRESGFGLE